MQRNETSGKILPRGFVRFFCVKENNNFLMTYLLLYIYLFSGKMQGLLRFLTRLDNI